MKIKVFIHSHASARRAADLVEGEMNTFLGELANQDTKILNVQLSTSSNESTWTVSAIVFYDDKS